MLRCAYSTQSALVPDIAFWLCLKYQDFFISILEKQCINLGDSEIDEKTIKALERNERYKWFKFILSIDKTNTERLEIIYEMFSRIPQMEFRQITIKNCDNAFINTLVEKTNFETKQDLFKVLNCYFFSYSSWRDRPYEYISDLVITSKYNMAGFCKQASRILIDKIESDFNIDWTADKIELNSNWISEIKIYNLGTQEFLNSIKSVKIKYLDEFEVEQIYEDWKYLKEQFLSLDKIDLAFSNNWSLEQIIQVWSINTINKIEISDNNYADTCDIGSQEGWLLLYAQGKKHQINYQNLLISWDFKKCFAQGEYVIAKCNNMPLEFEFKGIDCSSKLYESVEFYDDENLIVLHNKYVHYLVHEFSSHYYINFKPVK